MSKMLKRQNRYLISPFASGSNMAWCETVTGHVSIYNFDILFIMGFFFFALVFIVLKIPLSRGPIWDVGVGTFCRPSSLKQQ